MNRDNPAKEKIVITVMYLIFMIAPVILVIFLTRPQFKTFFGNLLGPLMAMVLTASIYLLNAAFLSDKFSSKSSSTQEGMLATSVVTGICFYLALFVGFLFGLIWPASKAFVLAGFVVLLELSMLFLPKKDKQQPK